MPNVASPPVQAASPTKGWSVCCTRKPDWGWSRRWFGHWLGVHSTTSKNSVLTDGNLNRHLKVLQDAALVESKKACKGNVHRRYVGITPEGRQRFLDYVSVLEQVVVDAADAARARKARSRVGRPRDNFFCRNALYYKAHSPLAISDLNLATIARAESARTRMANGKRLTYDKRTMTNREDCLHANHPR